MECSREKEIFDIATVMRHGLTFNKNKLLMSDISEIDYTPGYFAISNKSKETTKSISTNNISDIFQSFKNSDGSTIVPRFILIEGAPGMGKTTLCKEIAYQWAEQCLPNDTKLLFLLYLRDLAISNIKSLKDLVHYFYNFDQISTELSEQCAGSINDMHGKDLTIIFDGFDEFDSSSDSLITKILNRYVLPECRIVVTSRLTASDRLHRIADVRVQIMGFTDESKIQYIEQELKSYPDKINKLHSYLSDHEPIKSICYIPMMMTILVYMFKEKGQLPNNLTDLYDKFVALTISHHLQKQKKSEYLFISLQALPPECKIFLTDLSKFAFLSLHSMQRVFSKEDIKNLCPNSVLDISDLERLGLLISVQYFCMDKGHTTVFNFLHLSIHEYLAAYYINSIDQHMQFSKLENTFLNKMYQETWNMFVAMNNNTWLNFENYTIYCKDVHHEHLCNWIARVKSSSLIFLECIIELYDIISMNTMSNSVVQVLLMENSKFCNSAANPYQQHAYLLLFSKKHIHHTILELFVIEKVIKNLFSNWLEPLQETLTLTNKFSTVFYNNQFLLLDRVNQDHVVDSLKFKTLIIQHIALVRCHISLTMVDVIRQFDLKSLLNFQIINCTFELNALPSIIRGLSNLLCIVIKCKKFSVQEVDEISSMILNSHNLQVLDLSNNNLKSSAVVILQSLARISSLKMLHLQSNQLNQDIVEPLASVMIANNSLESLYLGNNRIGKGMTQIAKALQQISSLKLLDISSNHIPNESSKEIALAIEANKHLERLRLNNNMLSSSINVILNALCKISTLKLFNIDNNVMTQENGETLASIIKHNTGLEELHCRDNNFGNGSLEIAKALQQITSLQVLSLSNTQLPKEVSIDLALAIESNQNLKSLAIRGNNMATSMDNILLALSKVSSLQILDFQSNQLNNDAGELLAPVILNNKFLKHLYLGNNSIGKGMMHIVKSLQQITSLELLDLSNNNIPKEVCNEIAVAIEVNNKLKKLWLYHNKLGSSINAILNALCKLSTLKVLDLDNNLMTQENGKTLAFIITNNTGLEEIHLSDNNLGIESLEVAKALQQITSLQVLSLSNTQLPKEVSIDLALAIESNQNLKSLAIRGNNMATSMDNILLALSKVSSLQILDFQSNQLNNDAGELLAPVILNNKFLKHLYLGNNSIGKGMMHIVKSLQQITSLELLDLSNNNIPKEVCNEIAVAIEVNNKLKKLWLYHNKLGSSINAILNALCKLSTLKVLDLDNNLMTQENGKTLAFIITNNTGLEEIHLSDNNLGIESLEVAKALQQITSLQVLSLSNTQLPKEVSIDLALAIESNQNLKSLAIRGNNMATSMDNILLALSKVSSLQILDFQSNQLNNDAGELLAPVILNNKFLKHLYLGNNSIGKGMMHIVKSLQQITSLEMLDLGNNNIPKEVCNEIAVAIEVNNKLKKLWLCHNKLGSSINAILNALCKLSTLKVLHLDNNLMTQENGKTLAFIITHNTGLEEIHLNDNNLGIGSLEVAKALQQITSLQVLSLSNTQLPKEVSIDLALAIESNQNLKSLAIHGNNMATSMNNILLALSKVSSLRILYFQGNQLNDDAGELLAPVILNNKFLKDLRLRNNNIGKGMMQVVKSLQQMTSLELLDLGNNSIPKEVCNEIAVAIEVNNNLEKLWLHNNMFCTSINVILNALCKLSTLKVLNLDNNLMTQENGQTLAFIITHNTGLEELHLNNNNLGIGSLEVAKALQQITSLKSLNLGNNEVPQKITDQLAIAIESNNSLEQLSVLCNNFKSLLVILQALYPLSNLKVLDLYQNSIVDNVRNILASVISKNTKLKVVQLNLLTTPLNIVIAMKNLSALETLVICTCNISKEVETKIAFVIANNKSLKLLSLSNINLSQIIVLQAIATISNLNTLWLEDNLLSEEMSGHLSLAISNNESLGRVILLDNMLQTGLIKIAEACNRLSNIQQLQLAHNCIAPSKVVELTSIITQNTSLETVLLGGITFNAAECFHYNINEVLQKIAITSYNNNTDYVLASNHFTCLEVIYLEMLRKQIDNDTKCMTDNHININAKNFNFIQKIHHYFKSHITEIMIQEAKQKLAQLDAKEMISSLYILEKVKVIDLENNNIGEDASFEIATALHFNNLLEQLWLRGNKLNTAGALYILNSLEYLTTLRVLDLSYNNIGSQSADGIAAVIDNNPLMNQLWLDGNDLHSTGTITICNALKKIRTLSILSLCNNEITDDAADELSAVITQNVLLDDLLLSNNQLHSTGIKIVAESLSKLIKLRKLDLFNNDIGNEGASTLAIVIQNSNSLQDLFLSSNNLETCGALEICNALSHINSLHVLTLSNNNISDEVTSQLIEVLNNNHLYALLIGENSLECGGLKIAQVIENDNIAMQLLNFSNNNISEQDKEKIKVVFSKRANFKLYL